MENIGAPMGRASTCHNISAHFDSDFVPGPS